ncbi:ExbD/TolR family protein [Oceanisphaera arctica]|uniref:Biopolymer transporter ExbD n=1 Tax=Oceanisphaera arctica TaxID=641510 RepID=A0A2P5TQ84_9GAMM|nr:biopolymer transporter ExbD [Oceanisphaera arctica]PPL17891.1 biopolymer transporter ExbD [Oceanisphaera arctica]GHA23849.1 biopolymer transporter ExbD [Oceanisphaera arctica]
MIGRPEPAHSGWSSLTPDITPLLDIIFIVLVFLMLTANIPLQSLEVDLPKTDSEALSHIQDNESVTINLLAGSPAWALQGEKYEDWEQFKPVLLSQVGTLKDTELVLASDKEVTVDKMLKLLAFLQEYQIQATQILMEDGE